MVLLAFDSISLAMMDRLGRFVVGREGDSFPYSPGRSAPR